MHALEPIHALSRKQQVHKSKGTNFNVSALHNILLSEHHLDLTTSTVNLSLLQAILA